MPKYQPSQFNVRERDEIRRLSQGRPPGGTTDGGTLDPGSVTLDKLEPIPSPRLLGRGTSGDGPVEILTVGTGLAMTGTVLSVTAAGLESVGYWTPITNGDPLSPELLFDAAGDCVVGFVPTP